MMKLFEKLANGWKTITIFTEGSIIDVWQDPKCAPAVAQTTLFKCLSDD